MFIKISFLSIVLVCFSQLYAKVYTSQRSGPYNDSFSWMNNEAPGFNCSDTILIKHKIELNNNLKLKSGAYIKIDSSGRLCGHYTTTVESSAYILCFGVLQLDSLQVFGGVVELKGKSRGVFTESVIIKYTGARMSTSERATFAVGPWFVCQNPQQDSKVNPLSTRALFSIAPNPSSGITNFNFDNSLVNQDLYIRDINGRIIYQTNVISEKIKLDLSELVRGIYLVQIVSDLRTLQQQILVIGD